MVACFEVQILILTELDTPAPLVVQLSYEE